VKYFKKIMLK